MSYPNAKYPSEKVTVQDMPERIDGVDTILAEHINKLQQEVIAIQQELGVLPKGDAADVATRIGSHLGKTANQGHTPKIIEVTAATYTLQAEDNGAIIRMNSASPQEVILPAGLDVGHETVFKQVGEGQTTLVAGEGATIEAFGGKVRSTGRNATFGVYIDAEDVYTPVGNLEAV